MKYLYRENNQTLGPVDSNEILRRIGNRSLNYFDLISKVGEPWKPVFQFEELVKAFDDDYCRTEEVQWTVLVFARDGSRRLMGPFNIKQVHESLARGKIKFNDWAWREGMAQWYSISFLEEFQEKANFKYFRKETPVKASGAFKKPLIVPAPKLEPLDRSQLYNETQDFVPDWTKM